MSKHNVGLNGEDVLHFLTTTLKRKRAWFPTPWFYFLFPADQAVIFLTATQQRVATIQTIAVNEGVFRVGLFFTVNGDSVRGDGFTRLTARRLQLGINQRLQQIGASVEDAALNLGANSFRSFKDVIIPLLKAPFLSGFVLSFLRSVTCLSVVIFLYAPSTTVGTISVMVLVQSGQWGEAAAFTVVLITIAFTVLRLAQWILGRQGIKLEL